MTIREAIHRVKRLFRETNADSRLTDRTVYSLILNHARWLISRESDKLQLICKDDVYQTLRCVDLIEVPLVDSCCGVKTDCVMYRTKYPIPELYEDSNGSIIKSVTTIDGQTSLTQIKFPEWERKRNNPWINQKSQNKFFWHNENHLWFPAGTWKKVNISGLFREDVTYLPVCDDPGTCGDETQQCVRYLDRKFIMPQYLEAQLYDAVIKDLSNTYKRVPEKSNDINKNDIK